MVQACSRTRESVSPTHKIAPSAPECPRRASTLVGGKSNPGGRHACGQSKTCRTVWTPIEGARQKKIAREACGSEAGEDLFKGEGETRVCLQRVWAQKKFHRFLQSLYVTQLWRRSGVNTTALSCWSTGQGSRNMWIETHTHTCIHSYMGSLTHIHAYKCEDVYMCLNVHKHTHTNTY